MTQPPGPSPYSQQGSDEQTLASARPTARRRARPCRASAGKRRPVYTGPPRGTPAPPNWRPPTLIQVPAARRLPDQSDAALDEQERSARTITYGVGMITGAIALMLLFVICGRLVF